MAPEEGASLEGVQLSLWGWSSSDAENTALSDLVTQFSEETGERPPSNRRPSTTSPSKRR